MNTHAVFLSGRGSAFRLWIALFVLCISWPVHAFNIYLDNFNTTYGTSGTRLNTCGLCHYDFNGGGPRTPYGEDFRNNNFDAANVGLIDSDSDGFTNDQEAALVTLTHPGLSCSTLVNALNLPANLADYVDPGNPGCVGPSQPPVANPNGPYVGVIGQPIALSSAGSFDPDGTIVSYFWSFGAFGTSIEPNPTPSFNTGFEARLLISLTVTDNAGNSSTASTFVTVLRVLNLPPTADAGLAVIGVANQPAQFDGSGSFDPEGSGLSYAWTFGDGSTGIGIAPAHSYGRCGSYPVDLTVSDSIGLTGTATTTATISSSGVDAPVANAGGGIVSHYDGTVGTNVQFDGSSSFDIDCDIVTYSWDFGDGGTGLGITPAHSYGLPGDYVVTLTVVDNDGLSDIATATVTVVDTGPLNGQALYDTNCGGCHGLSPNSAKVGADVTRINNGIATVPGMNSLGALLSAAEIQAIADYLMSLTPLPPPATRQELYDFNCGACHGLGPNSAKAGADVNRINNGIVSVPAMNSLGTTLSAADIQAIADYLQSLSAPTGGEGLYVANCSSCHGVDGSGGLEGGVLGSSANNISRAVQNEAAMQSLSFLTANEIQQISDFLNGITTPPPGGGGASDGATVWANNCAGCHGTDGSAKAGATVARINNGISSVASMNFLANILSAADIQALADFLSTAAPPSTPEGLYVTYCSACHGVDARGGSSGKNIQGDSARSIRDAINKERDMRYLNFLNSEDIQAIASHLSSLASGSGGERQDRHRDRR